MKEILQAINDNNLIFISAQPDEPYFHWQVEIYLYQFSKHGIIDNCYALFGYKDEPSERLLELESKYKGIKYYKDERVGENKNYQPTIRPHLLKKFFHQYPELKKNVFYHDSDIFLVRLPDFHRFLNDDICYLSDTVSYLGYKYISNCAKRYKKVYPDIPDDDIFYKMCEVIEIDPELVKKNENNAGGAQYLLKNMDHHYWNNCEKDCIKLHNFFKEYDEKYKIDDPIQSWTVDMWCVLWNIWKQNKQTIVDKDLDFSWATDPIENYHDKKIFHLAGVTKETNADKFDKTLYTKKCVIEEYKKDPTIFDHISENSATKEYVNVIIEYINKDKLYNNLFYSLIISLVIFFIYLFLYHFVFMRAENNPFHNYNPKILHSKNIQIRH